MRRIFWIALAVVWLGMPSAFALGVSQKEGAGGFDPEGARIVVLPVNFMNFYRDPSLVVASEIGYHNVDYQTLDRMLADVYSKAGLSIYDVSKFVEDAKMTEPSNGRAMGQLYQDFAQVLKGSISQMWPLLGRDRKFYLGRQFGNTLERLPLDLNSVYLVVPMGIEFKTQEYGVFGFLGVAVIDKDAEIITAAAVRYNPVSYNHAVIEKDFRKLAERTAKELRKPKKARKHPPCVPEIKKYEPTQTAAQP